MSTTTSTAQPQVRNLQEFRQRRMGRSASGETFPVYDPSTEEVIAHVAAAGKSDVDAP